jgi:hypothetical protein
MARVRAGTDPAVGIIKGPVVIDQLGSLLGGCWFLVNHKGADDPGTKTVYAACPQAKLTEVLKAYQPDKLWDRPHAGHLVGLVQIIDKGNDRPFDVQAAIVHLIQDIYREHL